MRAYQDMVFSTTVRLTGNAAQAEDISQDVFLKAYEHFDRLRSSPTAGGWLKTVATNLTLNHLTRHRKRWRLFSEVFTRDEQEAEDIESAATAFEDALLQIDDEQRRDRIGQALQGLPEHQRVPLVLYHFEDMPYQEIATRLGHSLAKIKTDILRGRVAMAKALTRSGLAPEPGCGRAP